MCGEGRSGHAQTEWCCCCCFKQIEQVAANIKTRIKFNGFLYILLLLSDIYLTPSSTNPLNHQLLNIYTIGRSSSCHPHPPPQWHCAPLGDASHTLGTSLLTYEHSVYKPQFHTKLNRKFNMKKRRGKSSDSCTNTFYRRTGSRRKTEWSSSTVMDCDQAAW